MDWTSLGGAASGPALASWGEEEMQFFATQSDGQVWNRYWDGQHWHPWESLGGAFRGPPAASAKGPDRIDVFAIGADGMLQHRWWDGKEWVPWETVKGAPLGGEAVACSWVGERLDVLVWGADLEIWYTALTA